MSNYSKYIAIIQENNKRYITMKDPVYANYSMSSENINNSITGKTLLVLLFSLYPELTL